MLNETRYEPLQPGQRPEIMMTQSSVGKLSASMLIDVGMTDVYKLIKEMHADWGMFFLVDVVWNHTASDSAWLREHPEAGYNLKNSPHLKPAYDLDRVSFVGYAVKTTRCGWFPDSSCTWWTV